MPPDGPWLSNKHRKSIMLHNTIVKKPQIVIYNLHFNNIFNRWLNLIRYLMKYTVLQFLEVFWFSCNNLVAKCVKKMHDYFWFFVINRNKIFGVPILLFWSSYFDRDYLGVLRVTTGYLESVNLAQYGLPKPVQRRIMTPIELWPRFIFRCP